MVSIPVFEWAQVKVAQAFLAALPTGEGKSKRDVMQRLAVAGGVTLKWDENGHAILQGAWSLILQTQVLFARFLTSVDLVSTSTDVSNMLELKSINMNHLPQSTRKGGAGVNKSSQDAEKSEKEVNLGVEDEMCCAEENEVYVNITLSSFPFSSLNVECITQKSDTNHEEQTCNTGVESRQKLQCIEKKSSFHNSDEGNTCTVNIENAHIDTKLASQSERQSHNENLCIGKEQFKTVHSAPGLIAKEVIDNVREVSKYLKIPLKLHITTNLNVESRNHIEQNVECLETMNKVHKTSASSVDKCEKCKVNKHGNTSKTDQQIVTTEPCKESQAYPVVRGEIQPSGTFGTESSDSSVHYKDFDMISTKENVNGKALKGNVKKKKNYEELTPFKFFCSLCSFKSKRESHYHRHLQLHDKNSQLFACEKCSFTTIRLGHLRRHELSHSNTALACNLCSYRTSNQKFLAKHKRIKHNSSQANEKAKEVLHCMHCEYSTNRTHFLQRHLRVHGSCSNKTANSYQCEQCPYKTTRREHLTRHASNVHSGHRPFLCHHCGKAFKRQDALKQHSTTHMTQAAVMCPVCGKGCRSQAHLTQHLAVHSTIRSFLCELCGSAFKTRAAQRKHILTIHHHPKAFFCHHCSRKFSTKYALRRHIKQHGAEKKTKPQDEVEAPMSSTSVAVPDVFNNSMRMLQADAIFIQDAARNQMSENSATTNVHEASNTHEEEKITVQLTENYDPESLRVIPSHNVVQHSNETATALLYLTGSFAPY